MTSQNLNLRTPSDLIGEWENYELTGSSRRDVSRCPIDRKTHESRLKFQKYCTKSEQSCYTNFSLKQQQQQQQFLSLMFHKHSGKPASRWRWEGVRLCAARGRSFDVGPGVCTLGAGRQIQTSGLTTASWKHCHMGGGRGGAVGYNKHTQAHTHTLSLTCTRTHMLSNTQHSPALVPTLTPSHRLPAVPLPV